MSKVESTGREDYSKFDNIDSDILEAYLRADLNAPDSKRMEPEAIFYIIELLSERQKDNQTDWQQKTSDSWAEFCENYYPYIENAQDMYDFYNDFGDDKIDAKSDNGKIVMLHKLEKYWRRFASVAAVMVLFMFAGTVGAYALGFNPVEVIGRWNEEVFWLEPEYVTSELADKVAEYAGDLELVPKWLPSGYILDGIEILDANETSFGCIHANFLKTTEDSIDKINIDYRFPLIEKEVPFYEKDIVDAEQYVIYGTKYYIINNLDTTTIIWRNVNFEGSIKGRFSIDEAKKVINSIYGE